MKNTILITLLGLVFIFSCKKQEDATLVNKGTNEQRSALLTNLGNNLILPNYKAFNDAVYSMDSAVSAFQANPDSSKLVSLQKLFKDAYMQWQHCSVFCFGPASDAYLTNSINIFPADTAKILANISSGSYNLDAIANQPAKGFPAMDYLLFNWRGNTAKILPAFTTDSNAANRKKYLSDISAAMKLKIADVLESWKPDGGNYIQTFTSTTGTDVGSSLGLLVNALTTDYEILKNYKLGYPLGKMTSGTIYPDEVEAYYSGISIELAIVQLKAIRDLYLGNGAQPADSVGLDDYLDELGALHNGSSLNAVIKNQFNVAIAKLQEVPGPLSVTVVSNPGPANAAYTEIQKLLVLLKTDMPSAMYVKINSTDQDGD